MSSPLCSDPDLLRDEDISEAPNSNPDPTLSRRGFLKSAGVLSAAAATSLPNLAAAERPHTSPTTVAQPQILHLNLNINGQSHAVSLDSRTSLLDALREYIDLTGSKKGCDHGQCGACTVLLDGRRANSCLTLAAVAEGYNITTIEGLAVGDNLHPVQAAFLDHDGYQCGYCTPGQICSAVALLDEQKKGELSVVSFETGHTDHPSLSDLELKERMSGNICRCGAYPNIVAAVRAVSRSQGPTA